MKIRTLLYIVKQGLVNIFRNKWFSLATVATIAACLFLFGMFYSVLTNFENIVKVAQKGVSVTAFLEAELTDEEMVEIGEKILARVEVSKVEFVSEDEAWEEFKVDYLGDAQLGFPDNPLEGENNYAIYLSDVSMQKALVTYLESLDGIRLVVKSDITAATLSSVNLLIAYVSMGVIVILFAVSIFLISNTVTIGISVRKDEIAIMKYVGATDFFVRAPFVIEGIMLGFIGAVIPLYIVYFLYDKAIVYITGNFAVLADYLSFLPIETVFARLIPISLLVGIGIGFLGSLFTVKRHLKV